MHLFHKWNKWELKQGKRTQVYNGIQYEVMILYQIRYCLICGKSQIEIIDQNL